MIAKVRRSGTLRRTLARADSNPPACGGRGGAERGAQGGPLLQICNLVHRFVSFRKSPTRIRVFSGALLYVD